ncbi:MAG: hypothetical protein ACRDBM_17760 [Sporomusa sp.]
MTQYVHEIFTPCSMTANQLKEEQAASVTSYNIAPDEEMFSVRVVNTFKHERMIKSLYLLNLSFEEVITNKL